MIYVKNIAFKKVYVIYIFIFIKYIFNNIATFRQVASVYIVYSCKVFFIIRIIQIGQQIGSKVAARVIYFP